MDEAITKVVNATVATFVDKAITGAMQQAFTEAVEKAVKEKVSLAQENAEATKEKLRVVMEDVKASKDSFDAAVDEAVKEQMIAREAAMQKQFDRSSRAAVLRAKIEAVCLASPEPNKDTDAQGIRQTIFVMNDVTSLIVTSMDTGLNSSLKRRGKILTTRMIGRTNSLS
jgi:flavin-binding protein dodecin